VAGRTPHWKVPDARGHDEAGGLFPEPHLGGVVEIEAVGDDAVAPGRFARRQRRLHRARGGGQDGFERQESAAPGEAAERRHLGDQVGPKAGDVEDQRPLHPARPQE
jgi:hypothetical protein